MKFKTFVISVNKEMQAVVLLLFFQHDSVSCLGAFLSSPAFFPTRPLLYCPFEFTMTKHLSTDQKTGCQQTVLSISYLPLHHSRCQTCPLPLSSSKSSLALLLKDNLITLISTKNSRGFWGFHITEFWLISTSNHCKYLTATSGFFPSANSSSNLSAFKCCLA